MIWQWVEVCQFQNSMPTWDGLRAVWRRVLNEDGTTRRHYTAVEIHPMGDYVTVHMDGPERHEKRSTRSLEELDDILSQRNL